MDTKRKISGQSGWIDKGNYWLSTSEQLSERWCEERKCRVTGSRVTSLVRPSFRSTPETAAEEITGIEAPTFDNISKQRMEKGIRGEPYVRKWYSKKIGKEIEEMGLAVPKWDLRFGSSVDGIISEEEICEIKIPSKMYKPLLRHKELLERGFKCDKYYHDHIWDNHYNQMQLGMVVTGKKFCHYIVYLAEGEEFTGTEITDEIIENMKPNDFYCEVIPFNLPYWEKLYKKACKSYEELIAPLMRGHKIKRIDPE